MKRILIIFLLTVLSAVLLASCLSDTGEPQKIINGEGEKTSSTVENIDGEGEEPSPAVVYRIEVDGGKREYSIGEEFDGENLVVTFIGETERVLTADEYEIDFSSFNGNVLGEYIITVSYKGNRELETEYTVRVMRDEENENVWGKDLWL